MKKSVVPSRDELVELIPNLRRFAYALAGNRNDGDDLVQSTLERLITKGVPEEAQLKPWAFRVCRNLRIDAIRSAEIMARLDPEFIGHDHQFEDGERTMINQLSFKEATAAMDTLPADQQAALALVALEGYSYAEAAETLDVSIGTIMSRIYRARQKLAKAMGDTSGAIN